VCKGYQKNLKCDSIIARLESLYSHLLQTPNLSIDSVSFIDLSTLEVEEKFLSYLQKTNDITATYRN